MRRLALCFVVLLTILFGLSAYFFVPEAEAAPFPNKPPTVETSSADGPVVVRVGVYVINLDNLDTATGAFTADFYLDLASDTTATPDNFEFSNGAIILAPFRMAYWKLSLRVAELTYS